jgi:hypothetical protein
MVVGHNENDIWAAGKIFCFFTGIKTEQKQYRNKP